MDTRVFGTNLLAFNQIRYERRRLSPEAAEDAYYKQHTPNPADRRALRIASVVTAVWVGVVTIGFWMH